jgi:hypothetical protein
VDRIRKKSFNTLSPYDAAWQPSPFDAPSSEEPSYDGG